MNRLTKDKRPYEAPQLTVVSFKMERGFAESGLAKFFLVNQYNQESNTIESREDDGSWGTF